MILLTVFFGIVCLVTYSPVWAFIMWLVKPLRANDHFGDLFCTSAGPLVFILASSVGLHCSWRVPTTIFGGVFGFYSACSLLSRPPCSSLPSETECYECHPLDSCFCWLSYLFTCWAGCDPLLVGGIAEM